MTVTLAPTPTGTSTVPAVTVVAPNDHVADAVGSRRSVAVVVVCESITIRCEPPESGVTLTGVPGPPAVTGAARRETVKVRDVSWPAPSRAVTVIVRVPVAGVVRSTRSAVVTTPSTEIRTVTGAMPPAASTYRVVCSGSSAVPVPGSAMCSPLAVANRTVTVGVPPRLTTSASKMPVTPAWAPIPIHISRTPALTAIPSSPFGATNRRASGRYRPCHSPGIARAVAGTPLGPALPDRSSTAVRKAKPTTSSGPTSACGGSIRMNS